LKTANLAIVFTDIKGFTERTSRQTLEENQRLLKAHHDLLTPVFKSFGGRIIKSIGDAFLVTFESPTQAVLSGMAIQDRLWHYNRSALDSERLDVRVAINVGEVRLESNDIFGEPVNIASRVESITEAGEVYFTEAVYLAMNKAEVPSQEVGSFELKGIPGKIRVFRVPHAPYRVEAPTTVVHLSPGADAPLPNEQPPFGNQALSRIPGSSPMPGSDLAATAAALGTQAATLGGRLLERTRAVLRGMRAGGPSSVARRLAVGGGVLALLLGIGFVLRGSAAERAIQDVAKADSSEEKVKLELANEARKLISKEKDLGEKVWLLGQLDEALGAPNRAVDHYRAAVKAGNGDAEDRLIELLKHEECRVRANAADALGDLKVEAAFDELDDLAKNGGAGEEPGVFLLGCNSRKAAQKARDRLGR
jgi:class 3 adenylate cyclase